MYEICWKSKSMISWECARLMNKKISTYKRVLKLSNKRFKNKYFKTYLNVRELEQLRLLKR